MKKNLPFYLVAVLSLLLFSFLQVFDPQYLQETMESATYGWRLKLRNEFKEQHPDPDIVIVMIDDKSVRENGRWPWPRGVQAELVNKISAGKPKVIGIDLMYIEPEDRINDAKLAAAIKKAGNVVLATPFEDTEHAGTSSRPVTLWERLCSIGNYIVETIFRAVRTLFALKLELGHQQVTVPSLPDYVEESAFMTVRTVSEIDWKGNAVKSVKVTPPLAEFGKVATLGNVSIKPDMDGVLRREILYINYGTDCYPSFSLQIARIALKLPMQNLVLYGGAKVELGNRFIDTDLNGRSIINYRGGENTYKQISATDLLKGRVSSDTLKDKIILVGTSALATYDQKATPFSASFPGVEKNATVVDNILRNDFIRRSPYFVEQVVIIITSLLLIIFLPRLKAKWGVILSLALMGSYIIPCQIFISYFNIWLNASYPILNMSIISASGIILRWVSEEKYSRQIRAMFSSYVTERLVNEMIRNPEMAQLGGQKREVTVLFSDVVGFTTYSENHQPEEVVAILNEYLGAMTDIVLKWEGILDKFIGDAIVVFWGAPMKQEDHAERAVRCALEMQECLDQLRLKWEAEGKTPLSSGIGLNSGEAIVGNIGAQGKKMDYTVIGDHVNLGARVEGLTRRYGARVLMTEYTLKKLRPAIAAGQFRGVSILGRERVIVKGKDTPVGIFAVNPLAADAPTELVECDPEKVVRLTEK